MQAAMLRIIVFLGLPALMVAPAVLAQHSTAEFEHAREVTLDGEVKEVQWTNPHAYLQVHSVEFTHALFVKDLYQPTCQGFQGEGAQKSRIICRKPDDEAPTGSK